MATTVLTPNADSSPKQWTPSINTLIHYSMIDEGTNTGGGTPDDSDYIETQIPNNASQFSFLAMPSTTTAVSQIDVNIRGWIDDADGETDSYIELRLFHSGSTPVAGNPKTVTSTDLGGQRVIGEVTKSWTGLSLTKAQLDSIELKTTLIDPS